MPEINEQLAELGKQTTALREYVEREIAETKKLGTALPETKEALAKITAAMDAIEQRYNEMKARMERVEEKAGRPGAATKHETPGEDSVEVKAYRRFIRGGRESMSVEEQKALAVSSDPQGGYWVVPQRMGSIIESLVQISPMRQIANVVPLSGSQLEWPKENAVPTPVWPAEEGTRSETSFTPAGLEIIPAHELYAEPHATNQMIEDSQFNIDAYLEGVAVRTFAKGEGTKFISGNGVGCPFGIGSDTGITAVAQGEASALTGGDGIIALIHALPSEYAPGSRLIMNRTTLGLIRKLKGGDGHYLWWPDYTGANPPSIQGTPYTEMPDMPDVATNAYPIIYGNFMLGYVIADRVQISLLRDPYTSTTGSVKFKFRKRVGGKPVLQAAFRKLKIAVSV